MKPLFNRKNQASKDISDRQKKNFIADLALREVVLELHSVECTFYGNGIFKGIKFLGEKRFIESSVELEFILTEIIKSTQMMVQTQAEILVRTYDFS